MSIDQKAGEPNAKKTVLVFGAIGQQGGVVVSALLSASLSVRAFVCNVEDEKALALASSGAELAVGNMADNDSIRRAMRGAYGVFSVQPSSGQGAAYGVSDEQEVRYGKAIADIAAETGVQHLVYTSVNAAGTQKTGMGHFDSKSESKRTSAISICAAPSCGPQVSWNC